MVELKIKIPEDLKRKMEKFEVDWSPAIRRIIERNSESNGDRENSV